MQHRQPESRNWMKTPEVFGLDLSSGSNTTKLGTGEPNILSEDRVKARNERYVGCCFYFYSSNQYQVLGKNRALLFIKIKRSFSGP